MWLEAQVDGRTVRVEVRSVNDGYAVSLEGQTLVVDAQPAGRGILSLLVDGQSHRAALQRRAGGYTVHLREDTLEVDLVESAGSAPAEARRAPAGPLRVAAPMPGRVVKVLVEPGQEVHAGQGLVVMEAMKMENELRAPRPGRVAEVRARERQAVEAGALLVVLD
jgi:biotin carboxyl carrier protein